MLRGPKACVAQRPANVWAWLRSAVGLYRVAKTLRKCAEAVPVWPDGWRKPVQPECLCGPKACSESCLSYAQR